jgi:hypothetical protein
LTEVDEGLVMKETDASTLNDTVKDQEHEVDGDGNKTSNEPSQQPNEVKHIKKNTIDLVDIFIPW